MPPYTKSVCLVKAVETINETYPKVDITVEHGKEKLLEGVKAIISALFPQWPVSNRRFKQFTAGKTNKLFYCHLEGSKERVLVRVYGRNSEHLIDRDQELMNITSLNKANLSPPLYGRFNNGFCYGFFEGVPLTTADMSNPVIYPLTAGFLGHWHQSQVSADMTSKLWETIKLWLTVVPTSFDDLDRQRLLDEKCSLDMIKHEITELKPILDELNSPIVFCHNDLLCENILYDQDKGHVRFIDYEYANYGPRGFDIGNHFCEFAGMDTPVDYSKYPNKELQLLWLRHYLTEFTLKAPNDDEVYEVYREVNKYALAAHLYWGIWALVQARYSDIDFDYLTYASIRFDEYFKNKDQMLSL